MKKDSIISLSALVLMLVFSVPAIAQEQSANKGKLQWLGDFSYFECSSHNGLTPHSVAVDYGLQYGKHFQMLVCAEREHTRLKCADGVKSWLDSANLGGGDYLYYGHALKGGGKYAEAIEYFKKTYDLDNTQSEVLKLISDSYLENKDHDSAVEYLKKFIATKDTKKASDYTAMAKIYLDLAEQALDQAAKEEALLKANKAYADMAVDMPNNEDYVSYQRAHIHHMINGDIKKGAAKPFYEKYVELLEPRTDRSSAENTTLAEAYNYLAVYYIQNDNIPRAKEYAAKLQGIQPDNETAKQILAL